MFARAQHGFGRACSRRLSLFAILSRRIAEKQPPELLIVHGTGDGEGYRTACGSGSGSGSGRAGVEKLRQGEGAPDSRAGAIGGQDAGRWERGVNFSTYYIASDVTQVRLHG